MRGKKLTIGMAVYNDYDGAYFSLQAIRMYHREMLSDIEFVIIDNCPDSEHGNALKRYTKSISEPTQYIPFSEYSSAFLKGKVFECARTPYVLVMDCHVFLVPSALNRLVGFYDSDRDGGSLLQGPMLHDNLSTVSTHFDLQWRGHMWGTWGTDKRGVDPNSPPFEIPAQGMGTFSCRKDSWLGFNPLFRGFGGEEGYIHEKYRKAGKKTLCLPFLRWMHRFGRPSGVPFPLTLENKIKNYFIGFEELKLDTSPIYENFLKESKQTHETLKKWHDDIKKSMCIVE